MSNKERVFIIIDGNNFYHRLKESFPSEIKLLNFCYQDFAECAFIENVTIKNHYRELFSIVILDKGVQKMILEKLIQMA